MNMKSNRDLPNTFLEFGHNRYGDVILTLTMDYAADGDHVPARQSAAVLKPKVFAKAIEHAIQKHPMNPDAATAQRVEQLEQEVRVLKDQIELLTAVRQEVGPEEVGAW